MNYILSHWRGELSIGRAFWVNLIGLRVALLGVDQFFQPPHVSHIDAVLPWAGIYFFISLGVILPWQVVGVIRTTDRMVGQLGARAMIMCAQVGVMLTILPTAVTAFAVFQPLLLERPGEPAWVRLERERAGKYDISVSADGAVISVRGEFVHGLTRSLASVLGRHAEVREVVLHSAGGLVTQGRAVARLVEARGLDTRVTGVCKSACVLAFMGGVNRRVHPAARIGFHRYRYAARVMHPDFDLGEEHRRDTAYLTGRGVNPAFVARIFDTSHAGIWVPSLKELKDAGVVTEVVDGLNRHRMAPAPVRAAERRWIGHAVS